MNQKILLFLVSSFFMINELNAFRGTTLLHSLLPSALSHPSVRICPAPQETNKRISLLGRIIFGDQNNPAIHTCPNGKKTVYQELLDKTSAMVNPHLQKAQARAEKIKNKLPEKGKILAATYLIAAGTSHICLTGNPKYVCLGKGLTKFFKDLGKGCFGTVK